MGLEILDGPPLARRTTLGLGGKTRAEIRAAALADLDGLADALARVGARPLALGGGSNLLAVDRELDVAVVSLSRGDDPEPVPGAPHGRVRVAAWGGLRLGRLVSWCSRHGLAGISGMAGIPGSVGGAVAGNAGSYGRDMAGVLAGVWAWTPKDGVEFFGPDRFTAGYRRFSLTGVTGFFMIARVLFDFSVAAEAVVRQEARAALEKKKATQPIAAATAGCLFKNPPGESAGRLLDLAGFRGRRLGGMEFSAMHANFLVNRGGGASDEAFALIDAAREAVRSKFGHELELEVRVVS
ncbi:FAD-binding protein [Desulfovibrio sulfodismutans]|uniref:UDP-N-acetylenolpyruvoylglucosamine reductase n=1 Tax=Desulfolutivibrio sulfodismutans TaxID=63561 RepID=A0A7K3NIM7_9BACT|nr:FAD-binding protein [Desulfolutivibrio sulfodismutans]NDY56046.1 FAD-binding protein [Desulfolutivibrio sulfodismutans]QLA12304.1 FAD-binding protein [Desulfolutivibrio sulfodismutans DSM 3696]